MKSVFFYSEKCVYCKEAYDLIQKIGVDKFVFVNVENESQIPDIIDRVPMIMTQDKMILKDQELFNHLLKQSNIEPFMVHEMGGSLSDRYSYVDNSSMELDHSYSYIDKEYKINTPSESDSKKIINYDQFIAERDNDLKLSVS